MSTASPVNKLKFEFANSTSAERPECIDQIRAEVRGEIYRPAKRKKEAPAVIDPDGLRYLFTICSGNRWLELGQREPAPKMLFGEFWHKGELCILFADTNTGKSVLAVQIGDSIARNHKIASFACDAPGEIVLYADFELNTIQFYQRYSHSNCDYAFPENFYRTEFNYSDQLPEGISSYDDYLLAGLESKLRRVKATVLIIDNLSSLRGGTESAIVALRLINRLKKLKAELKLSILLLAHTPKYRHAVRPISVDDLHGSKILINFADSAFAIGKSQTDTNLRYIKQLKQRNTEQLYGEDNVCLCRIVKPGNFIHFEFDGQTTEWQMFKRPNMHGYNRSKMNRDELAKKVNELAAQGLSQRKIAEELGIAVGTVNKLIS